ncbi:MAG: PadR family transcriptional regulator [Sphingobium sp.]|nr:PadR family transcriptional regulator [Sphingobium sp.]
MTDRPSLGQFEQLVLTAILKLADGAYGVTIHRGVEALMTPRSCQLGAVYATLDRLEDKGLIESWLSEPTAQRGGRARRHYRLSAEGAEALKDAAATSKRLYEAVEQQWGEMPWSPA